MTRIPIQSRDQRLLLSRDRKGAVGRLFPVLFLATISFAQQPFVARPESPLIWRPYRPAAVASERGVG